ncbi:probable calcium-binding protein CML31 [Phalaenopsis equestris]|uniref:probable calcium-binding protein CML31 n=1 Tax=Phalaenopsis equestris TaxID=78828 RepID=UPI0009E53ED4|nr:probable calcium-binding protein CML31 [Phalaenopsis equestris]
MQSLNQISLERVFCCFDENGDGRISSTELRSCMSVVGYELSLDEARAMIDSMDANGDGQLSLDEFIKLIEREEEDDRMMIEAFKMYQMDSQDCITAKSLKRMLSRLGYSRNMEICEEVISKFDINGDGVLSFDEFKVMMMA